MKTRGFVPWLYILPASILILFFLVYPTVRTLWLSCLDHRSVHPVGIDNYRFVFASETTRVAVRNNLLWMIVFPVLTVSLGLVLAVLADKVTYERAFKAVIFLPMAISFVGAGVIWRFVYAFRPIEVSQVGLLNALVVACGGQPQDWLSKAPWVNNLCLIFIGVWIWTGFCMTVFSAAYKGLPAEIMEAARMDGAGGWQLFWQITLPLLRPTIGVVTITMAVFALKVFDIIYVTTNGLFDTEVLANRMYKEMFLYNNMGRASAIATLLLVASVLILGVNMFRQPTKEG